MRYDLKYQKCHKQDEPEPGIVFTKDKEHCWVCGAQTAFIDIDFDVYVCSEECEESMWEDYRWAAR